MNRNEQEKYLIEIRRERVYELHSKGFNNTEISNMLSEHVSEPTVSRDLAYLKLQAREKVRDCIDHELPNEYQKILVGLNSILKEAWTEAANSTGKDKMHALDLAQRTYQIRLELFTRSTVVDDAVKFIEGVKKKKKLWEEAEQKADSVETEANQEQNSDPSVISDVGLEEQKQEQGPNVDEDPEAQF